LLDRKIPHDLADEEAAHPASRHADRFRGVGRTGDHHSRSCPRGPDRPHRGHYLLRVDGRKRPHGGWSEPDDSVADDPARLRHGVERLRHPRFQRQISVRRRRSVRAAQHCQAARRAGQRARVHFPGQSRPGALAQRRGQRRRCCRFHPRPRRRRPSAVPHPGHLDPIPGQWRRVLGCWHHGGHGKLWVRHRGCEHSSCAWR
jgi:hypothetical protein